MSRSLKDVNDENGTPIQNYAELLIEKCDAADIPVIILSLVPPKSLGVITNADVEGVPTILRHMASLMEKNPPKTVGFEKGQQNPVLVNPVEVRMGDHNGKRPDNDN